MRRGPGPIVTCIILLLGCTSDAGDGARQSPGQSQPDLFAAEIAIEPDQQLVGRLVVESENPVVPVVEVVGDERSFEVPVPQPAIRHEIPVVGLRAEHDYVVTVTVGDEEIELDLRTGAVPDDFPELQIEAADKSRMSEGFTLFNLLGLAELFGDEDEADGDDGEPPRAGYLLAIDAEGEVVWYHRSDHPIGDARQLDDGTILHEYNDTGARRIDLFGETLQEWAGDIITGPLALDSHGRQVAGDGAVEVSTDSMHHEVDLLDNGNLVTVSSELRTYDGFPADGLCGEDDFDGSYDLIVDVIVEFTPEGEVVAEYPLADYFDPVNDPRDQNVCGLPFDSVFPNWLYRAQGFSEALDWTHANGVVVDPSGNHFTVSVRHLDAILQIDRESGELAWRFGPGGDFTVGHPSAFPSYQHAPEWQPDGTLLVYDNGNARVPGPGTATDAAPFSRAIQYRLDPEAGRADVVWEYASTIDGEAAFASFVGDADRLENGNVLVTNGGYADRPDQVTAQIVEVVPDDSPEGDEIVFEMRIVGQDRAIAVYRAERIPSFYPAP